MTSLYGQDAFASKLVVLIESGIFLESLALQTSLKTLAFFPNIEGRAVSLTSKLNRFHFLSQIHRDKSILA